MEKYKKTLKRRNAVLAILILCMMFSLWLNLAVGGNEAGTVCDFMLGFTEGICTAGMVLSAVYILKNILLMKDGQKLQLAYNKENDERMKLIRAKAGMPMMLIMSIIFIAAGMIISHFYVVIGSKMVAMGMLQVVVGGIVKGIYSKIL